MLSNSKAKILKQANNKPKPSKLRLLKLKNSHLSLKIKKNGSKKLVNILSSTLVMIDNWLID